MKHFRKAANDYDEDLALTQYLMAHCAEQFTEFERRVLRSILARKKLARLAVEHHLQSGILDKAHLEDADVNAALAGGVEAFHRRICQRIMAVPAAAASVNRCPRCLRVVRTPLARQCLWCGYDWHRRDAKQSES